MTLTTRNIDGKIVWVYWKNSKWVPVPVDEFGFPTVEWLKDTGCEIESSRVITERHRSLCGKSVYQQGYRVDTYRPGAKPKIQGQSNETRVSDGVTSVYWPISTKDNN